MILYHGSNEVIDTPDLKRCRPFKDFGRGFYLTTIEGQAINMARRTTKTWGGVPSVTTFEFDESALNNGNLSVKCFDKPNAEWATFIMNNRNRKFADFADVNSNHDNKYDVVVGAVADDDIALLFRTFASGFIDINGLVSGLEYKELTDQYSFHTQKAIACLKKVEAKSYE